MPRRVRTGAVPIAICDAEDVMNTAGLIRLVLLLVLVIGLIWYLLYGQ
jgi:hypothetical protein